MKSRAPALITRGLAEITRLGLELATKRQEHIDLDGAIHAMIETGRGGQMSAQRLKKKKLALKDRITEIEDILMPDIIA